MKKPDFPLIADCLFYAVCAGLLSLCILRYYRVPTVAALSLAALFALAACGIVFFIVHGKHRRRALSQREREEKNALLLHLALERPEKIRALLLTAFKADGREAHCLRDELFVDGVPAVALFTMQPVSADETARLIRAHGEEKFSLFCNELSPESETLARTFSVPVARGDDVYELLKRTDSYPEKLICGEIPRRTVRTRLRRSFSKRNARPFFVSGILLLLMSLFTLFPVYYLITGGVLLLTSVAVRLFGATP